MPTAPRTPGPAAHGPAEPLPRSGDVLEVSRTASVQFGSPIRFRVIRVHDWPTYHGWLWLEGYQLDGSGEATERRSIFVQAAGLRRIDPGRPTERRQPPRPRRAAPHRRP